MQGDRMTVNQFLNHISYSAQRPHYVSHGRWIGMQEWYITRIREMKNMRAGEHI